MTISLALISSPEEWHTSMAEYSVRAACKELGIELCSITEHIDVDAALAAAQTDELLVVFGDCIVTKELIADLTKQTSGLIYGQIAIIDDTLTIKRTAFKVNMTAWSDAGCPQWFGAQSTMPDWEIDDRACIVSFFDNLVPVFDEITDHGVALLCAHAKKYGDLSFNALDTRVLRSDNPYFQWKAEAECRLELERFKPFSVSGLVEKQSMNNVDVLAIHADPALVLSWLTSDNAPAEIIVFGDQDGLEACSSVVRRTTGPLTSDVVDLGSLSGKIVIVGDKLKVTYRLLDVMTPQLDDFLSSISSKGSFAVDVGQLFVNPSNFFKTKASLIRAHFRHCVSSLTCRKGPSYMFGEHVDYQNYKCLVNGRRGPEKEKVVRPQIIEQTEEAVPVIEVDLVEEAMLACGFKKISKTHYTMEANIGLEVTKRYLLDNEEKTWKLTLERKGSTNSVVFAKGFLYDENEIATHVKTYKLNPKSAVRFLM